ncbi:MAG: tyrosine--tRNA ligase [Candidatus Eremiobacteraeota bacterium]|nr:tyrosine--tRNA ligase [Candidatus Eremiobacteraeota bacterium]
MSATPAEAAAILADGCDHISTREELERRLRDGERLHVKFGIDPTGSELHLGHAVVLHKMQQFVELGHRVTLLIGDYTARIGDPSGRNDARPPMTGEKIDQNMRTYREQAGRVLDLERIEIMYNSTWLAPLTTVDWIRLLSKTTVAQILEREDFKTRYTSGTPIALHELLYPVAQAFDSVAMRADVELGGNDQLFNLLLGRAYQIDAGQKPQVCMTTPILEGTDGVRRMGKSLGNYISLIEPAHEQFGKVMRLPDELIARYARLAAFWPASEVAKLEREMGTGRRSPMDAKKDIAEAIAAKYHGTAAGREARERFERTVQRRELPDEMPTLDASGARKVADVLLRAGFAESKRAAERLIAQGGVRIDGEAVTDPGAPWNASDPAVLSVGSRRFVRVFRKPD